MYICLCCILSNVYSVSVEESVIKSSQQLRKRSSFPEGEAGKNHLLVSFKEVINIVSWF